jgi:hypothetical protein
MPIVLASLSQHFPVAQPLTQTIAAAKITIAKIRILISCSPFKDIYTLGTCNFLRNIPPENPNVKTFLRLVPGQLSGTISLRLKTTPHLL